MKPYPRRHSRLLLAALLAPLLAHAADTSDISDLPLEQLLNTEVITAAKLAHQVSNAASAVSIVTAEDIRTYGYRTLADILNSMRGLHVSFDGEYGFLGGRGFGAPGEYAGRITLLIDGYRAQDNYYGQSFFGTDGLLDVEMIERVEYIPGPGSTSYGDGAFLGVINIITRKGKDFGGPIISQEFGSHGWRKSRLTYGETFANGLDLLFSVSDFSQSGRSLSDASANYEHETAQRYFLKAGYEGWSFESAWSSRPLSANYDPSYRLFDTNSFANLKYDGSITNQLKLSTMTYWGEYRYHDNKWTMETGGRWYGIDSKLVATWFDNHTLVIGSEYRDDYQQTDRSGSDLYHQSRQTLSFYAYDDIWLNDKLQLNLGVRQDKRHNNKESINPRGALIFTPWQGSTFKLSSGMAHRQPTAVAEENAKLYGAPLPAVERVKTNELVWEQQLDRTTRLITSVYRYKIDQRFYVDYSLPTPTTIADPITTRGAEVELEHAWENGARLRTSFIAQDARNSVGEFLVNVPRTITKFNLSIPIASDQWRLGWGTRLIGARNDAYGGFLSSAAISDLTLSGKWQNLSVALSARNLFDKTYQDVTSFGWPYPSDGRNYWLQFSLGFK
jgi:iron complex outermembrane receptor protein